MQEPDLVGELVYGSYQRVADHLKGPDRETRDISLTDTLLRIQGISFDQWICATVTGSKGKGSTAVLLARILSASGNSIGLITSPHLRNFRERIRIDGKCVSEQQLHAAAVKLEPAVRQIESTLGPLNYLGPGGVILALAATIFEEVGVSVVVIEAGRGGEYDEARCARAAISVITPIMLEHPDKLGATVEEIARTKALITFPGCPIISAPQPAPVEAVIAETALELKSPLFMTSNFVRVMDRRETDTGFTYDLEVNGKKFSNLSIGLSGTHQVQNASSAILAASKLESLGATFLPDRIPNALRDVRWPGRNQIIQSKPMVAVDGAINAESARHACELAQSWGVRSIIAVVAVPAPKDLDGVCREVSRVASQVILTEVATPNLQWYKEPLSIGQRYMKNVAYILDFNKAISAALARSSNDSGLLLIGTQSFVGAVLERWDVDTCNLWP